jgi:hypothetical protein
MMKRTFVFSLALILVLTITSAVFADSHTIPACTGDAAEGTIVYFDEDTFTVTIAYDPPGDEDIALCTVTFQQDADFGHPITTLLGNYFEDEFGSYDPDAFGAGAAAFAATQVCVVEADDPDTEETVEYVLAEVQEPCAETEANLLGSDGTGTFMLLLGDGTFGTLVVEVPEVAETETVCVVEDDDETTVDTYVLSDADPCEGEGFFEVTVTTDNGDGTFVITFEDTTTGTLVLPEVETLAGLEEAAAGLVEFSSDLSADGVAWAVGDDIAERHDDGFGFGVIVKLYAIAMEFDQDLDEMFDLFDSGTGMGHLFKEYGKPGKLGVGHVRQDNGGSPGASGLCNENAAPHSAAGCGPTAEGDESGESANPNSNKDKTKTNKGKNNKGD